MDTFARLARSTVRPQLNLVVGTLLAHAAAEVDDRLLLLDADS